MCFLNQRRSGRVLSSVIGFLLLTDIASAADNDWASYLGDSSRSHYSTLRQITKSNVRHLDLAWTYHSGDARSDNFSQIQCNPLIVDGVLYGSTPQLKLVALSATNGSVLWQFDPFVGSKEGGS